jgi:hypothetical protein
MGTEDRCGTKIDDGTRAKREGEGPTLRILRDLGRRQQRPDGDKPPQVLHLREAGASGRRERTYPGFVWKEGIRYLAQSAIFVLPHRLPEIRHILEENGIDHDVEEATFP